LQYLTVKIIAIIEDLKWFPNLVAIQSLLILILQSCATVFGAGYLIFWRIAWI